MNTATITDSIDAGGATIGARVARHMLLGFRHFMDGRGAVHGEGFFCVVTGEPHPLGNVAFVSVPDSVQTTKDAIAPLLKLDLPTAALFPDGVTDSVAGSLADQGFSGQGAIPAMAVDIDRMAGTSMPPGYEWARIGDGEDGRTWTSALADGYGLPTGLARMFSPESQGADMSPGARVQFFAIRRRDRLVATSLLFLADGLAGIYCVSTLPDERGKGLGAHATAEALRAAQRQGYRVGVLQSSAEGHSVYRGLGFSDVGGVPIFVRMPAA